MFNKILQSSKNPENVSMRVQGVLLQIVGVIVLFTGAQTSFTNDLGSIATLISEAIGTASILGGQLVMLWGAIRTLNR